MYSIEKRIQHGRNTVGYQLVSDNGVFCNLKIREVKKLCFLGLVRNAKLNLLTFNLVGLGIDLRSLPIIQLKSKNKKIKSNHRMAFEYMNSNPILNLEFLPNDRVRLVEVLDKESTDTFIVPSFITDYTDNIMFQGCKFTEICVNNISAGDIYTQGFFANMYSKYLKVRFLVPENLKSTAYMFSNCKKLLGLDLSQLNTSDVKNMEGMFFGCRLENPLDVSNLKTSKVRNMSYMFSNVLLGKSYLDLSKYDTSNVEFMNNMFFKLRNKTIIEDLVSSERYDYFEMVKDISKSKKIPGLYSCINVSNFDTRKVKTMGSMFSNCNYLDVDVSSFNLESCTNIELMFSNCFIDKLDLSNLRLLKRNRVKTNFLFAESFVNDLNLSNFKSVGSDIKRNETFLDFLFHLGYIKNLETNDAVFYKVYKKWANECERHLKEYETN